MVNRTFSFKPVFHFFLLFRSKFNPFALVLGRGLEIGLLCELPTR